MLQFTRWVQWLTEDVPAALATCEFDCRRSQCRYRDWEACTRVHPIDRIPVTRLTTRSAATPPTYTDA